MGKNIDQLQVITSLADDDLLYARVAADPVGTADSAIRSQDVINSQRRYGQIYKDINVVAPDFAVITTPRIITQYDFAAPDKGMIPNFVTGTIVIPPGVLSEVYRVTYSASFSGTGNEDHAVAVYIDGLITALAGFVDLTNNATSGGNISGSGLVTGVGGQEFDMRIWVTSGVSDVVFGTLVLSVERT
jgi:hypothetical protein